MPVLDTAKSVVALGQDFYSTQFQAMGSVCRLSYQLPTSEAAEEFHREVQRWAVQFEARYSRYTPGSLINEINGNAGRGWVDIDAETERLFSLCDWAFSISDGCFDPSALPLIRLWDFKASPSKLPDARSIAKARRLVGWNGIERASGKIRLPREGMGIDIGGIGKEYAVDRVAEMAHERGIGNLLVDFGQDLRVHGDPPEGGPWRIGLEDPCEPGQCWGGVALEDGAVATSGDYQRNFTLNGKRYGHIIDPRTGYPVSNQCRTVSVIAPNCATAGVLSTAAFILGPDLGLKLLESRDQAEGCIVTEAGRSQTAHFDRYHLP